MSVTDTEGGVFGPIGDHSVRTLREGKGLVRAVCDLLHPSEAVTVDFVATVMEDILLFDRKQHDYGLGNIAALGEKGVFARAWDKANRLKQLVWNGKDAEVDESIDETWQDLAVYAVIARLVRRGLWH